MTLDAIFKGDRRLRGSLAGLLCVLLATAACGDDSSSSNNAGATSNGTSAASNQTSNGTGDGTTDGTTGGDTTGDGMVVAWTSFEDRPCPEDSILTYDNFGGPFLLNWCTGCHNSALPEGQRAGATVGVDFDTPEMIQMWAPRIWARSADDNLGMPPVGGPSAEERFLMGEWLACGAP